MTHDSISADAVWLAALRAAGRSFKRVIERDHVHFARLRDVERICKFDFPPAAAAFGGLPLPNVIDQDCADQMRRQPEKLRAIIELNLSLSQQPQIDLRNDCLHSSSLFCAPRRRK